MKNKKTDDAEKDDKSDKSDKKKIKNVGEISKKALFIQRFMAYCIDILIVSFVVSIVALPFYNEKEIAKYEEKMDTLVEKVSTNEIAPDELMVESTNITYNQARVNGIMSLITIIVEVLYFVIYQLYNGGQTLGKKMMKIKVVSKTGELTTNQMLFRALIINSILLELISFGFMLFSSKEVYFFGVGFFDAIQSIIIIVSVLMVMYSKSARGIHDLVTHTEVLKI